MPDCPNCKGWAGCPGQDWYSPGDIRYCPQQVYWLIHVQGLYEDGRWPPAPRDACPTTRGAYHSDAYFVVSKTIIGELNWRLAQCGRDGEILRTLQQETFDVARMVRLLHMPYEEVQQRVNWAMRFCTGWRRKRTPYADYKKVLKYQGKKIQAAYIGGRNLLSKPL